MRVFLRLVAVALIAAAAASMAARASAATFVVGNDPSTCPGATYTTIGAAVAAASAGDTVQVCPGVYPESVTITKPLTLVGPGVALAPGKLGNCSRQTAPDSTREAIVESNSITLQLAADGVSVKGFVIQAPPSGFAPTGVQTFQQYSGYSITGNLFQNNSRHLWFDSNGTNPSTVSGNCFRHNSAVPGGTLIANGVLMSNASNATFNGNAFFITNRAFNVEFSSKLTIENNASSSFGAFAYLAGTTSSTVQNNTATGSGVLLAGDDSQDLIANNTFTDGGVGLTTAGNGGLNTQIAIVGNTITNMSNAAISAAAGTLTGSLITNNINSNNGYGIWMQSGNTGNRIQQNVSRGSANYDCEDDSTGTGTAGTGNTWISDRGRTSSPPGICR
jgi:hypothetical protein